MTPPLLDTVKVLPSNIEGHGPGFAVVVDPHPKTRYEHTRIADAIRAALKGLKKED